MTRPKILPLRSPFDAAASALREAVAKVLRAIHHLVRTKRDDPEDVRKLRVAIRRVNAAVEVYGDYLPAGSTRKMLRRLNTLRRAAGAVRDCDILMEHLAEPGREAFQKSLASRIKSRRDENRRELLLKLEAEDASGQLEQLASKILHGICPRRSEVGRRAEGMGDFIRRHLQKARRQFCRYDKCRSKKPRRLHAFRLEAKALRYQLEVLSPALGEAQYKQVRRRVARLCRRLGSLADQFSIESVARDWIHDSDDPVLSKQFQKLSRAVRKERKHAVASFYDWYTPERRKNLRRLLKEITGALTPADALGQNQVLPIRPNRTAK